MTDAPPEGRITTEVREHVLLMGFDRAAKRNAFGPEMLNALSEAYAQLHADDNLRCGVVHAHGAHFTAGLDLVAMAPILGQGQAFLPPDAYDPWGLWGRPRTKPVVVAVQGMCLTLGIELILASDVTVAARDARFAQIEVKRGIFPFGGATLRMPERVGWGNAMRYLLTGDELDAQEAWRIGLVQEVVDAGQQLERAVDIATRIARQAPLAVQATLHNAVTYRDRGLAAAQAELAPTLLRLAQTEDAQEGMMSFVERREARFRGR
ncbi:MAG: crotonase/enoyl-CoA hydratase family protein [Myxococcota bacterium]